MFHDTFYVVAHFHYVLSLGAVVGVWITLFLYFPFMFHIFVNFHYQTLCFFLFFVGANLLFFPLHFLGFWGLPRHYMIYDPNFYCFGYLSLFGIILLLISVCFCFYNMYFSCSSHNSSSSFYLYESWQEDNRWFNSSDVFYATLRLS